MMTGESTAAGDLATYAVTSATQASPKAERDPGVGRVRIDRVVVDMVTMDGAVERISSMQREERTRAAHVVTVNAQFVQLAWRTERFAELVGRAELSVADGVPLVWASRLLGEGLPGRVNGADLMVRLCQEAAVDGTTVYFMGGKPGAAEATSRVLRRAYPGLKVAGVHCPRHGFLDGDVSEQNEVARRIREARPDLLFVALGAPAQEYWIETNAHLPAKVMIGVGGSFELVAGFQRRAPHLVQRAGCEWLWRLVMEPRRLWKRYAFGNSLFILLVLRQMLRQLRGPVRW